MSSGETGSSGVLPDAVVATLRDAILGGRIAPGAPVTEAFVSREFDMARPTARIGIDRLVAAGLLTREPHHAARVPRLGASDITDLFAARAALEAAAVELLAAEANIPPNAQRAHDALAALAPDAAYAPADIAFHRALVEGAPSTRLPRLHGLLMGEIELAIAQVEAHRLRSVAEVADEHGRILAAIAAGDAVDAARLARTHVLASRDRLLAHIDSAHER
ncbi:GntR family transcriptional regulator [Homoserinibacter sp. GY 40078]|uniref:GntR family transcriptional regulator n=1 Tax=Homoserinibacter sp. GY 40078 TaxID=2603275 RepID=UPI0011CB1968|nr:GntR family transcriptional regulator [Homoserinibacter sp. GY 40078]TXK19445.1 GntR family transcriptional regulator [Homoserinibacter sp. GY 40078]